MINVPVTNIGQLQEMPLETGTMQQLSLALDEVVSQKAKAGRVENAEVCFAALAVLCLPRTHIVPGAASIAGRMLLRKRHECFRCKRRSALAAGGTEAVTEANLMVSERVAAAFETVDLLIAGGTPAMVIERFRGHVGANASRLNPARPGSSHP